MQKLRPMEIIDKTQKDWGLRKRSLFFLFFFCLLLKFCHYELGEFQFFWPNHGVEKAIITEKWFFSYKCNHLPRTSIALAPRYTALCLQELLPYTSPCPHVDILMGPGIFGNITWQCLEPLNLEMAFTQVVIDPWLKWLLLTSLLPIWPLLVSSSLNLTVLLTVAFLTHTQPMLCSGGNSNFGGAAGW